MCAAGCAVKLSSWPRWRAEGTLQCRMVEEPEPAHAAK
jgi:hypothetical protein